MKTIVKIVLAGAILVGVAYTGGPGTGEDRCLWPTNPNSPECARNDLPSEPT
jgi:hypothetical protein